MTIDREDYKICVKENDEFMEDFDEPFFTAIQDHRQSKISTSELLKSLKKQGKELKEKASKLRAIEEQKTALKQAENELKTI